jgi:hypothetical protein
MNLKDLPPEIRDAMKRIMSQLPAGVDVSVRAVSAAEDDEGEAIHDHSKCVRPFPSAQAEAQASMLVDLLSRLLTVPDSAFKLGAILQWKQGLRNRGIPEYGQPAIVMDASFEPIILDEAEFKGRPVCMERLDIQIGVVDEHGGLETIHVDSRRLEPYTHR